VAAAVLLLAALFFRSCSWADDSEVPPPSFTSDSIVNSANGSAASLTPNALATIYGSNLSRTTASIALGAGELPTVLAGVRITVEGVLASLLYVSPTQVNFLIPNDLLLGDASLTLTRQGTEVVTKRIDLRDVSPALFSAQAGRVAATHADGRLISADAPARQGEVVVIYGTGLGQTDPPQLDRVIPRSAAQIRLWNRLRIVLEGQTLSNESILYAGVTPGYAGLYQINLRLPERIESQNPELLVALDDKISQKFLALQVGPTVP
jgi:uncharacterized protein (TIGR03437 family)